MCLTIDTQMAKAGGCLPRTKSSLEATAGELGRGLHYARIRRCACPRRAAATGPRIFLREVDWDVPRAQRQRGHSGHCRFGYKIPSARASTRSPHRRTASGVSRTGDATIAGGAGSQRACKRADADVVASAAARRLGNPDERHVGAMGRRRCMDTSWLVVQIFNLSSDADMPSEYLGPLPVKASLRIAATINRRRAISVTRLAENRENCLARRTMSLTLAAHEKHPSRTMQRPHSSCGRRR